MKIAPNRSSHLLLSLLMLLSPCLLCTLEASLAEAKNLAEFGKDALCKGSYQELLNFNGRYVALENSMHLSQLSPGDKMRLDETRRSVLALLKENAHPTRIPSFNNKKLALLMGIGALVAYGLYRYGSTFLTLDKSAQTDTIEGQSNNTSAGVSLFWIGGLLLLAATLLLLFFRYPKT